MIAKFHEQDAVNPLLSQYESISLAEIQNEAALLDRVDTKYLLGISQLCDALEQMTNFYRVLDIEGIRLNHYQTVYFDTHDFALYQQHHNGFGTRYKVRARKYVDSDLAFFEIKHKNNHARTIKSRLSIPDIVLQIQGEMDQFLDHHTPFEGDALEPKIWNEYLRMTLVSKYAVERLTIDMNISFGWDGSVSRLPGLVIAEVKQKKLSQHSNFVQHMRLQGIRPASFSKYTAGVYSLYDQVKTNNFKPQIRQVHKIMQQELGNDLIH